MVRIKQDHSGIQGLMVKIKAFKFPFPVAFVSVEKPLLWKENFQFIPVQG
jgi:hypothetical protein